MGRELRVFTGTAHPALGEAIARSPGRAPRPRPPRPLQRRRGLVPDPGQRARRGRLRRAAHRPARQREPDGAAGDARRVQALERRARHRRHPVLRLRAPGPQGQAARADLRQAGGRPPLQPRAPTACSPWTCTPRRSRASSTRPSTTCSRPPSSSTTCSQLKLPRADRGLAGRRRRGARARLRQAAGGHAGHRRQAARAARTWPRCTTWSATWTGAPPSSSTTSWTPAARWPRSRRPSRKRARARCWPPRRTPCCRARPWSASRRARCSQLIVTDSIPLGDEKRQSPKIVVLSIAELMGKAIRNIHEEASVTSLFV